MPSTIDIAIIGAGAAGLAAGIFAAETNPKLSIALLDSAKTIGAKILVSGGGRCNVTNHRLTASDFHGTRKLIDRVLRRFNEQATVRWFDSLGVPLKTEATGKLFPVSNKARTVLDGLLRRCEVLGVSLLTHHHVRDISREGEEFLVQHSQGTLRAKRVILSTGGRSLPKTGSDGSGWGLAQQLGHTVTATYPALVPLLLEPSFFHTTLSGISHEVTLTTTIKGKTFDRSTGSLLWTHFGISGPVVLDASRVWVRAAAQGEAVRLHLHCVPELSNQDVEKWLMQAASVPGRKLVPTLLAERLPTRVATMLASIQEPALSDTPVNLLSKEARRNLVQTLTHLVLPVIGSRGWNFAEVTAGGVPLEEISAHSMGSRHMPGLYIIGEILDCDGRIGGFNFQWAWATGYVAGCHAALDIMKQPAAEER
ncbi:MAG: NAD(P)/FAD-dependent oxidoreductase [Nitrospirales bacterium]